MDIYMKKIEDILKTKVKILEEIPNTNNMVIKFTANNKIYYLKIYNDKTLHIDNELMLYQIMPEESKKIFKKLVYSNYSTDEEKKFAVFEEVKGDLLADLLDKNEIDDKFADEISLRLIEYFKVVSNIKTNKFGNLNGNLEGQYKNFLEYLYEYQFPTATTLFLNEKTRHLSSLPFSLLADYANKLDDNNNCITPIDSNFHNIMITEDKQIKIIDPGAIISAPISMGYGELVAHSYGTILYDKLIKNLKLDKLEIKKLSIYAILSLLNILAFLVRNNIGEIEKNKPFGNKYSFLQLIDMHLKIIKS